jgi:hypothetical protein
MVFTLELWIFWRMLWCLFSSYSIWFRSILMMEPLEASITTLSASMMRCYTQM